MNRPAGAYPNAGAHTEHASDAVFAGYSFVFFSFCGFFGPSTGGSDLM